MKAADVRILPALDPGESYVDPSFLLVETANDAAGEAVTTIHHVASATGDGDGWKVATLGHSARRSADHRSDDRGERIRAVRRRMRARRNRASTYRRTRARHRRTPRAGSR